MRTDISKGTDNRRFATILAIAYIALMGVGMAVMHYGFGYSCGQPQMTRVIFFAEVAMTILVFVGPRRRFSWEDLGLARLQPAFPLCFIPFAAVLILALVIWGMGMVRAAGTLGEEQVTLLFVVLATTLLVGVSEEVMFRGVLLHAFLGQATQKKAILISSIGFSLLHSANVLGGFSASLVAGQLLMTFFVGIAFALVALEMRTIVPLMLFHWLWDFVMVSSSIVDMNLQLPGAAESIVVLVCAVVFWTKLPKKEESQAS